MATQFMMPAPTYNMMGNHSQGDGHYGGGVTSGKNGGFAFRKRVERVDWRKIASVDIDHISRTLDFSMLQSNIMNITFCNLEAEMDIRAIDPNFVKLFKLSQLTIEYLLHSQEYLAGLCTSLEERGKQSDQEIEKLKKEIEDIQKEMGEVKKESHKRKKLLIAQQQLMFAGSENYKKCPLCAKAFQNDSYLQAHVLRRHAGGSGNNKDPNSASPDLGVGSDSGSQNNILVELTQIKERLLMQEEKAKNSVNSLKNREGIILASQVDNLQAIPSSVDQQEEDGRLTVLMKELREMKTKNESAEKALREMEARFGGKRSNLGLLEDDDENGEEKRDEVAEIKEQVQQQEPNNGILKLMDMWRHLYQQLNEMNDHMQRRMEKQERKWQKKVRQMTQQHAGEIRKLNNALESTARSFGTPHSPHQQKQQREVEEILRQSREQEKVLEAQDQMLEMEMSRSSEVKPLRSPNATTTPRGSARRPHSARGHEGQGHVIKHSSMYPSDDEEEASMAFGTGTSSLRTLNQGTQSMGFTGTQSLHASQFLEELRKNPTLAVMREELASLLQEHVERKGIPPDQTGISDQVLENKLAMLSTQRQTPMQKYSNFLELRNHFNKIATENAKRQFKEQMGSPRGPPPSDLLSSDDEYYWTGPRRRLDLSPHTQGHMPASPSHQQQHQESRGRPHSGPPHPQHHATNVSVGGRKASPSPRRPTSQPSTPHLQQHNHHQQRQQQQQQQRPLSARSQQQQQMQQQRRQQQQPQPQPRSKTPLSTGSTTEWTSTQFDSDEESESEEESDRQVGGQMFTPAPGARLIQSGPVKSSSGPSPSPRFQGPKPRLIQSRPMGGDSMDSAEDLDNILESIDAEERRSARSPSRGGVAQLKGAIQNQLGNRGAGNKPFGGVDITGGMNGTGQSRTGHNNVGNLDDASDWDDTTAPDEPAPVALRRPGVRTSADAMSTNTYGTSAWGGSSSKAASTVKDKDRRSTSRSSFVSVTDVSSDDDMNVDNI